MEGKSEIYVGIVLESMERCGLGESQPPYSIIPYYSSLPFTAALHLRKKIYISTVYKCVNCFTFTVII